MKSNVIEVNVNFNDLNGVRLFVFYIVSIIYENTCKSILVFDLFLNIIVGVIQGQNR